MSEKLDLSDVTKVVLDLRERALPVIESMKRILDIVNDAVGDIKDEIESWENEGGTVSPSVNNLLSCAHCGHGLQIGERVHIERLGERGPKYYHTACWSVVGK